MEELWIYANFLKLMFLITSPVTFLVGIFLLYDLDTYLRIEKFLAKTYGASKKTFASKLYKNRESLQLFLLKKRRIVGFICLLNSISAIFTILLILRKY